MMRLSVLFALWMLALPSLASPEISRTHKASKLAPGEHELTLDVDRLRRSYIVHVPAGYDGVTPMPVVIMFHGGGGAARSAMRETSWARKADDEGFLAVFPEAMPPDLAKPSRFGSNGRAWNDGSGRFHAGERRVSDTAFINALLDDLMTRSSVDRKRIYATGFSNGASMAFRVGVEMSERIAAIAPVAGTMWLRPTKLARPVSLYYVSGDADPLNPLDGGVPKLASGASMRAEISSAKPPAKEFVSAWAHLLGCRLSPSPASASPSVTTLVYSEGCDNSEVRFTVIKGHGHIWPGGKNLLPEWMTGKDAGQFNATDAIWQFFKRHALMEKY